ncbi:hypothetical protein [Bacillus sp. FJAT-29814]|uniref:hypothetical protein n=1 Tax=Bacillus sp. FJAT-29814 TaxID=1729688 RepID=UPI00083588FE|nr:hypothetical protein [Bacillus sp. FJAT-29814]
MGTEVKTLPSTNNNKNDVRVNNHISLTINLGDSLNVLTLVAGVYLIRSIAKKKKKNSYKVQWP